ncbi:MAG: pyridoxamine 5'-phosphate oxidase [Alphaproteobacteria bacterium]|nr:pyridoxamine 5'-phosphate oxidase [Alphaproteobacteria bacterium]
MLSDEIVERFETWLAEAKADKSLAEPTAMCLSTADRNGHPSSRIVLLKGFDARGFVFYSNGESRKATELMENTHAALCFYWMSKGRQVRVEGLVVPVSKEECDIYFASRHRESQIGAWASQQSRTMPDRQVLEDAIAHYEEKFAGLSVPRPPHWIGWRVVPDRVEFWQEGDFRLHDRDLYVCDGDGWTVVKLYP